MRWYKLNPNFNYFGYRNQNNDRNPLLPFLAGVLVTTPFIFLNKNQQQPYYPPYPYYPPVYYPPQYPIYYR